MVELDLEIVEGLSSCNFSCCLRSCLSIRFFICPLSPVFLTFYRLCYLPFITFLPVFLLALLFAFPSPVFLSFYGVCYLPSISCLPVFLSALRPGLHPLPSCLSIGFATCPPLSVFLSALPILHYVSSIDSAPFPSSPVFLSFS
jgi:hypothetical protein